MVIGGSYIACEVAATLAARGNRCTMVMQEGVTLERTFGAEIGGAFSAFWLAGDGRLAAALVVGRPGELEEARQVITERVSPARQALADADAGSELSSA